MKNEFLPHTHESSRITKLSGSVFFLVLVITTFVFWGSLRLDWTNWDDNLLVYENPLVSEAKFIDIFTKPSDYNTYNPLVISSFALEWKLVQNRPFLYHFNNLILHLFCTALVLLFFRCIGLSLRWSCFAALLFAIHPTRVESVAWITERKDVLFSFFYLAALLAYIRYIATARNGLLFLTFFFFTLALLSKVQAVVLPFVLCLLDWYLRRKISLKSVLEKVILLALSLIIGFLGSTFFFKNAFITTDGQAIVNRFGFFGQILLGGYAYTVYILKSIIPYATSPLYPIPVSLQTVHWIGAVIAVFVFVSALVAQRQYRFMTFGLLFFTLNICLLLMPFLASDTAFLHDRYTYIAYIGLFFSIAMMMQALSERVPSALIPLTGFAVAFLIVCGILTMKYIPVWKNSETLWTYVIEKYPLKIPIAYFNRGNYWFKNHQPDRALEDFNAAITINSEYSSAYANRSLIYLEKGEEEKALQDYNRYMQLLYPYDARGNMLNLTLSDSFSHRGIIYSRMNQYEKALADFNQAIELDSFNLENYFNRALTFMQLHDYEKAIQDLNVCQRSDPANADVVNDRGVCYLRSGKLELALDDFNKAILLNDAKASYYLNRAVVYHKLGQLKKARQDVQTAEQMGTVIDPSLKKILRLR